MLHNLLSIPGLNQILRIWKNLIGLYNKTQAIVLTLDPYMYMFVSFSFGQYPTAPCTIATSVISPAVDPITHAYKDILILKLCCKYVVMNYYFDSWTVK